MPERLEIVGPRSGSAPLTYTVTDPDGADLQSVFAHFDGTAAAGSFRCALTFRAQNGTIIARVFPSDELTTGDTADVTFAPFLRTAGGGAAGGGIMFDTFPQGGTYLFLTTTGTDPLGKGLDMRIDQDVLIKSETGDIDVTADQNAQFTGGSVDIIAVDNNLDLVCDNGTIFINGDVIDMDQTTNNGTFSLHAKGFLSLRADNGGIEIDQFDPAANIDIYSSGDLTVYDDNGDPIFRIDQDGDLHGKTGKSLVFDL